MRDHGRHGGGGHDAGSGDSAPRGAVGKRTLTANLPVQRRAHAEATAAGAPAAAVDGNLPAATRGKMEDAFDFSFAQVRVHEGGEAPALGAVAYTAGTDLHFAPGAYAPGTAAGDELIGHELAHVVQQSEGRVAATTQAKGVALNDDDGLEREADAWGAQAARGEAVARGGTAAAARDGAAAQRKRGVVQRAPVSSHWGKFVDTAYATIPNGVSMHLTFEPGPEIDAKKIGFTQAVDYQVGGAPVITDPAETSHIVPAGQTGAGNMIDRITTNTNPIYGAAAPGSGKLGDTAANNGPGGPPTPPTATYKLGHRYVDAGVEKKDDAWMFDKPKGDGKANSSMTFESTAVALDGAQAGEYYGSVKWGWKVDGGGTLTKVDFALISQGVPSANFLAAATVWNAATARGTVVTVADDTVVYDGGLGEKFKVPKDTKVKIDGAAAAGGVVYESVTIDGGAKNGQTGYIKLSALKDKGDGPATIDLPNPDVHTLKADEELNKDVPGPWRYIQTLPKGTRVVKTAGGFQAGKAYVKVVDGVHTGAEGYIDVTNLADELP